MARTLFNGVSFCRTQEMWRARLRGVTVGYFASDELAAKAVDARRRALSEDPNGKHYNYDENGTASHDTSIVRASGVRGVKWNKDSWRWEVRKRGAGYSHHFRLADALAERAAFAAGRAEAAAAAAAAAVLTAAAAQPQLRAVSSNTQSRQQSSAAPAERRGCAAFAASAAAAAAPGLAALIGAVTVVAGKKRGRSDSASPPASAAARH